MMPQTPGCALWSLCAKRCPNASVSCLNVAFATPRNLSNDAMAAWPAQQISDAFQSLVQSQAVMTSMSNQNWASSRPDKGKQINGYPFTWTRPTSAAVRHSKKRNKDTETETVVVTETDNDRGRVSFSHTAPSRFVPSTNIVRCVHLESGSTLWRGRWSWRPNPIFMGVAHATALGLPGVRSAALASLGCPGPARFSFRVRGLFFWHR